jgi:transcriptional regulator with XRE-family HTH domain
MNTETTEKKTRMQAVLEKELAKWPSQKALAKHLGITPPFLNQLLKGKATGERSVFDIAQKLGISVLDMMETPGFHFMPKNWIQGEAQVPLYTVSEFMERYKSSGMETEKTPDGWPRRPGVKKMTSSGEEEERRARINIENNDYQPTFITGDELIVDPDVTPKIGDLCMVILGDDLLFRKLVMLGDDEVQFCLPSDEFRQEVIKRSSPVRLVIWGKVMSYFRKL